MKKKKPGRGRRDRRPRWRDFRRWLMETKTKVHVDPDSGVRRVMWPVLRFYLYDHEWWGIGAHRDKWPKLAPYMELTCSMEWELVLSSSEMMCQCLAGLGDSRNKIERFLDVVWGPRGILKIPRDDYMLDADFAEWWEERKGH